MGLFSSSKKVKVVDPLASQKKEAANYLLDLAKSGTPNLPTQGVANLTDTQRLVQSGLKSQYRNANDSYDSASNYYADVLNGSYDPRTSDFYKGLRQEADQLKTGEQTKIRQGASLGGMLQSTPRMGVESRARQDIDTQTLKMLGGLYENERSRMNEAATRLPLVERERVDTNANINAIADQERAIEQARNDALYNQALQTVLFPYQYQANVASSIFNGHVDTAMTGGGMTDLGFLLSAGASAAGGYFGAKSDKRLKDNIVAIDNAVDKVKSLKGYTYNYKVNPPEIRNGGVMAQDLEKVLPDAVFETEDGMKAVRYDAVIGLLVSAVRELSEKLEVSNV